MNNFPVTLNITDMLCNKCFKETLSKELIVSDPSQTIALQEDYILNVLTVSDTFVTVIIQNGFNVIIRRIFTIYPLQISLPSKCNQHILTISVTIP